jgi:hypothetical protein
MPGLSATLAVLAAIAAGGPAPAPASPRLRPADFTAGRALERGLACCPTVGGLVRELEASDLIVYLETGFVERPAMGRTVLMGATRNERYVRVTLHRLTSPEGLIELLGHELQHAVEIARAPDVRDGETMLALFRRIGLRRGATTRFETAEARAVGFRVRAEISRRRPIAAFATASDADNSRRTRR